MLSWSYHFESFTVATMTWLTVTKYLCPNWPRVVVITIRFFPHSWLITRSVTRVTQRMFYVEQELFTRSEYQRSPPVFRGVRVARSLVFFLRFCRLLFFLLAIVLSVFLRFTSSGYSFDISKCFLWWEGYKWF